MSPTAFRSLIISSVLFTVAAGIVDALCPSLIPQSIASALEKEVETTFFETHPFISLAVLLPWLMAALASIIGLLLFKRWARPTALYSTLLGFVLYPLFGPDLSSAIASALTDASCLTWGAVLALAYYSSLSEHFVAKDR